MASTTYVHDLATGYRRELRPDDLLASGLEVSAARVRVVGHHLGHAVSAAGCSGFDFAAVLVVDGGGSIVAWDDAGNPSAFERTSIYRWDGRELKLVGRSTGSPLDYGNSVGDIYQMVTTFLGFRAGDEGKVMALASYGCGPVPEEFVDAVRIDRRGNHWIAPIVQYTTEGGYPKAMTDRFGCPRSLHSPRMTPTGPRRGWPSTSSRRPYWSWRGAPPGWPAAGTYVWQAALGSTASPMGGWLPNP